MVTPKLKEIIENYRKLAALNPPADAQGFITFEDLKCLCEYVLATGAEV